MIDYDILKQLGTTNERLREIFTAEMPSDGTLTPEEYSRRQKDIETRERIERRIASRRQEGMNYSLRNYYLYSAADLAWDTVPIQKQIIPLLMYAQGKIDLEQTTKTLENLKCKDQFAKKDEKGNVVGIDLPKFTEISFNLVRSVITRRLAAQANKFNNLWPYFKYEPRSTGSVAKLRGDALSQRVDIMADQFDWRHHDVQCYRDMFLYAHCVDFVRSSWEVEKQYQRKPIAEEFADPNGEIQYDPVVVKEGLCWINPHPTRVFYETASPLSSINSDTGCSYIGFWDVVKAGTVVNDPNYWNRDRIHFGQDVWTVYSSFVDYFNQYLDFVTPPKSATQFTDIAATNDRTANVGLYSSTREDEAMFLTNYYEKLIPKAEGIGDYPYPVWVRFVVASDRTVVFAEILPSTPGAYLGLNENDSRLHNASFAHGLLPYQDQFTNLLNQLLILTEVELLKVISLNKDFLPDTVLAEFRKKIMARNFSSKPIVLEFSLARAEELGIKPDQIVQIHETKVSGSITTIFNAMAQLIALVEKLEALSPHEQGQPAPREISATEVNEIAATTSSVYSFISDSIDEFRAAKKRIVYESLLACSKSEVRVPIVNRYPLEIIKRAGFEPLPDEEENLSTPSRRQTVVGTVQKLRHDYIFTSRDGAERAVNTQAANTLVQLLQYIVAIPSVLQAMGKEKLFELVNEIFRLSGAGVDVLLELQEGDDNGFGEDEIQQLMAMVQQLAQAVQGNTQAIAQQEQVNAEQQESLGMVNQLAQAVKKLAGDFERLAQKQKEQDRPPIEELNYKDAPPDVKRQMEKAAGYEPSRLPPPKDEE